MMGPWPARSPHKISLFTSAVPGIGRGTEGSRAQSPRAWHWQRPRRRSETDADADTIDSGPVWFDVVQVVQKF